MSQPTALESAEQDAEDRYREFVVRVSPETDQLIETLAREYGRSPDKVLLYGILLYKVASEAEARGKKFGVVGPDGTLETEIHF